ncbi:MAG: CHASE2 domain-containing protein [Actinobacteria bacterium]|nr:MAG: CHASE2 domain-containing protein [Actinomycetota bacterium]
MKMHRGARALSGLLSGQLLPVSDFCYRSSAQFYWALALFLSLAIIVSRIIGGSVGGVKETSFDFVMKHRWASPEPSPQVVILDIDEKSLAQLAPTLGRYPWKREIFGQVLAEVEAAGASSILFNILITDSDKGNEQSDDVLSDVAGESRVIAFPVVRLPSANDEKSNLHASQLPGAKLLGSDDPTVALILPGLPGMQRNLGISNLDVDDDGVLRRYSLQRNERAWVMPTLVGRASSLAGVTPRVEADEPYLLNWRNKRGTYQRISFVDYFMSLEGASTIAPEIMKGKHVVVGVSAPGVSSPKPTAANSLNDDNEILATAIDDALNGSNLKPLPSWAMSIIAIAFVWLLAFLFASGRTPRGLDGLFVAIEVGSMGVMFLAASYSNSFIDMTPLATFGLAFFSVARIHHSLAERVVRGAPEQLVALVKKNPKSVAVLAFRHHDNNHIALPRSFRKLESAFGSKHVYLCLDVFAADQILGSLKDIGCIVVISERLSSNHLRETVNNFFMENGLLDRTLQAFDIPDTVRKEPQQISMFISQKVLFVVSQLPLYQTSVSNLLTAGRPGVCARAV